MNLLNKISIVTHNGFAVKRRMAGWDYHYCDEITSTHVLKHKDTWTDILHEDVRSIDIICRREDARKLVPTGLLGVTAWASHRAYSHITPTVPPRPSFRHAHCHTMRIWRPANLVSCRRHQLVPWFCWHRSVLLLFTTHASHTWFKYFI